MVRLAIVAHIEGPVGKGTIIDTPDGILCVRRITREETGNRLVLGLEETVTAEPPRAIYPVLCPKCNKVFVYGVESERSITLRDTDQHGRKKKFFVMPCPCQSCRPSKRADRDDSPFTT